MKRDCTWATDSFSHPPSWVRDRDVLALGRMMESRKRQRYPSPKKKQEFLGEGIQMARQVMKKIHHLHNLFDGKHGIFFQKMKLGMIS